MKSNWNNLLQSSYIIKYILYTPFPQILHKLFVHLKFVPCVIQPSITIPPHRRHLGWWAKRSTSRRVPFNWRLTVGVSVEHRMARTIIKPLQQETQGNKNNGKKTKMKKTYNRPKKQRNKPYKPHFWQQRQHRIIYCNHLRSFVSGDATPVSFGVWLDNRTTSYIDFFPITFPRHQPQRNSWVAWPHHWHHCNMEGIPMDYDYTPEN